MKALILTHPVGTNYGGILQCFALKSVLCRLGFDVQVIDMRPSVPIYLRIVKLLLKRLGYKRAHYSKYDKMADFVKNNICLTKPYYNSESLHRKLLKNPVDVVVVGSDQVWKPAYAMKYGFAYFLDFVPKDTKRIAYAASFGTTKEWQFTPQQTEQIKTLLQTFNGVSVREVEGVEMCTENAGVKAEHVLDPTLLLNSEDYEPFIAPRIYKEKYILVYYLWNIEKIAEAVANIKKEYDYEIVEVNMRSDKQFVSVEEWLSLIKNAEFVITDSFHGSALSTIFNTPFNYVHKDETYDSRRETLISKFHIDMESMKPGAAEMVFKEVNEYRKSCQEDSIKFLKKSLANVTK